MFAQKAALVSGDGLEKPSRRSELLALWRESGLGTGTDANAINAARTALKRPNLQAAIEHHRKQVPEAPHLMPQVPRDWREREWSQRLQRDLQMRIRELEMLMKAGDALKLTAFFVAHVKWLPTLIPALGAPKEEGCGPPCYALNQRQRAFHLRILAGEKVGPAWKATANGDADSMDDHTAANAGSRVYRSVDFQEATDYHYRVDAAGLELLRRQYREKMAAISDLGRPGADKTRVSATKVAIDLDGLAKPRTTPEARVDARIAAVIGLARDLARLTTGMTPDQREPKLAELAAFARAALGEDAPRVLDVTPSQLAVVPEDELA